MLTQPKREMAKGTDEVVTTEWKNVPKGENRLLHVSSGHSVVLQGRGVQYPSLNFPGVGILFRSRRSQCRRRMPCRTRNVLVKNLHNRNHVTMPISWSQAGTMNSQRCMLSRDILDKLRAIASNCDELEARIPSPWCIERTAKIKDLTQQMMEMLRSSQCACGSSAQQ